MLTDHNLVEINEDDYTKAAIQFVDISAKAFMPLLHKYIIEQVSSGLTNVELCIDSLALTMSFRDSEEDGRVCRIVNEYFPARLVTVLESQNVPVTTETTILNVKLKNSMSAADLKTLNNHPGMAGMFDIVEGLANRYRKIARQLLRNVAITKSLGKKETLSDNELNGLVLSIGLQQVRSPSKTRCLSLNCPNKIVPEVFGSS